MPRTDGRGRVIARPTRLLRDSLPQALHCGGLVGVRACPIFALQRRHPSGSMARNGTRPRPVSWGIVGCCDQGLHVESWGRPLALASARPLRPFMSRLLTSIIAVSSVLLPAALSNPRASFSTQARACPCLLPVRVPAVVCCVSSPAGDGRGGKCSIVFHFPRRARDDNSKRHLEDGS